MVQKIILHELTVALGMIRSQTLIFVQIRGTNLREVDLAFFFTLNQFSVERQWCRIGGQADHAGRLAVRYIQKS